MIVLLFIVCGLAIGGSIDIVWWSIDALLGTSTITVDKAVGVIGLSGVGTALFVGAMMLLDEFGWRRRGHQPSGPITPGRPPDQGTGGRR